jgi:hypothetical protein
MTHIGAAARVLPLVAAAVMGLSACGDAAQPPAGTEPSASAPALEGRDAAAYERWLAAGIDDYRFAVDVLCFCVEQSPIVVTVRDGVVVSVEPEDPEYWGEVAVAVPDLFALVVDAREEYDRVEVTYDRLLGYPREIFEDRIEQAVDDEVTFAIRDFEPLT